MNLSLRSYIVFYFLASESKSSELYSISSEEDRCLNNYWINQTNWCDEELKNDIHAALRKSPGNCPPILVMSSFVAMANNLTWKSVLYGFVIGGVNPKQVGWRVFKMYLRFKYVNLKGENEQKL